MTIINPIAFTKVFKSYYDFLNDLSETINSGKDVRIIFTLDVVENAWKNGEPPEYDYYKHEDEGKDVTYCVNSILDFNKIFIDLDVDAVIFEDDGSFGGYAYYVSTDKYTYTFEWEDDEIQCFLKEDESFSYTPGDVETDDVDMIVITHEKKGEE